MKRTKKTRRGEHPSLSSMVSEFVPFEVAPPAPRVDEHGRLDVSLRLMAREDLKQRLYHELQRVFETRRDNNEINYKKIAYRLGIHPSLITRRMKGHTNLTLDVLSDLFLAMDAQLGCTAILFEEVDASEDPQFSPGILKISVPLKSYKEPRIETNESDVDVGSIDDFPSKPAKDLPKKHINSDDDSKIVQLSEARERMRRSSIEEEMLDEHQSWNRRA